MNSIAAEIGIFEEELPHQIDCMHEYADGIDQSFVNNISNDVHRQIVQMRIVGMLTYNQIADAMNGAISANSIRKLCSKIIPAEIRERISSTIHVQTPSIHAASIQEGKKRHRKELNAFEWSDEQTDYFIELLQSGKCVRPQWRVTTRRLEKSNKERERRMHYNHDVIAEAMNLRFGTDEFTSERSRRKLEKIREIEKQDGVVIAEATQTDCNNDAMYLNIPDDFALKADIQWLYLECITGPGTMNVHELRRALAEIGNFIREKEWEELIKHLSIIIRSFSPTMQQLLCDVAAECFFQMGDHENASKTLEAGLHIAEGTFHERLNNRLKALAVNEAPIEGRYARSRVHRR